MAIVRKTISLPAEQDAWVKAQVASGRFASDSEVHRALVKHVQTNEEKRAVLAAEIQKGIDSGFCNQTPREIIEELKAEMRKNGEL